MDLCYYLLTRGVCKKNKCINRHVILPYIDSRDVHFSGEIVFHRVVVRDGGILYAQLISSEFAEGNKYVFTDFTEVIKQDLNEYYQDSRLVHQNI